MTTPAPIPAAYFGMILGLAGLGQAWRAAARLWGLPAAIGEAVLLVAGLVWALLLALYLRKAIGQAEAVRQEFLHPVQGGTPALLAIATLLIAMAAAPHAPTLAWTLTLAALAWHLAFALWHTGTLWQGGRDPLHTLPTLYLPTVGGNFVSAAALGTLGQADWAWVFLGAGFFSWLALESLIVQRLWQPTAVPPPQRPLIGIQFAPPVVCAMAWLTIEPNGTSPWLLMLWGYGLFQLLLGLRLWRWLGEQAFAPSYWAYTFGVAAAAVVTLKLALAGIGAAQLLALPVFASANLFIGYLALRTLRLAVQGRM